MAATASIEVRLGRRIREVRRQKGLSQMDVVRSGDWDLSHYQKIERGVLDPRLSTVARLAESFGVSLSELLKGV